MTNHYEEKILGQKVKLTINPMVAIEEQNLRLKNLRKELGLQ